MSENVQRLQVRELRACAGVLCGPIGTTTGRPVRMWPDRVAEDHPRPGDELQARGALYPAGEKQTRTVSLIESTVNVASGFALSLVLWQAVLAPYFGYQVTIATNIQLTSVFTAVSVARGYLWRRFFANGLHRVVVRLITERVR